MDTQSTQAEWQDQGQEAQGLKEKAGQAFGEARGEVKSQLAKGKDRAAGDLTRMAQALHDAGHQLREQEQSLVGWSALKMGDQVERLAHYLADREPNEILDDVTALARRQPAAFLTVAFALGFLTVRFLKSSRRATPAAHPNGSAASGPGSHESGYHTTGGGAPNVT